MSSDFGSFISPFSLPLRFFCNWKGDVVLRPHRTGCDQQEFKISRLKQNVERLSAIVDAVSAFSDHIDYILDWENPQYTFFLFVLYMFIVFFYRPW